MSSGMKRKFCLTPTPSQAGLDIQSVPKVTERLRDIHLDRESTRAGGSSSSSSGSKPDSSPRCPDSSPRCPDDVFCFDEIEFSCGSASVSPVSAKSMGCEDYQSMTNIRSTTITPGEEITDRKLPTVFKWEGGGKQVYLSGSFDNWKSKIPMVKSHGDFYTIIELPEGEHQFKFLVDNQWVCDSNLPQVDNDFGSKNNVLTVNASDFEVFEALAMDSNSSGGTLSRSGLSSSPTGEYSQHIPTRNSGYGFHHSGPPILPPHLLQVILNKEIPMHCEPTLLPEPNHVMLNHLYALSIKDGVMVLSATHRYRKKYVTTLLYKPIQ